MLIDTDFTNRETTNEAEEIFLPPVATDLLESMRALGYSFESAVADLLDNSISAQARNIDIRFSPFDAPYVAILDDGIGMSSEELTAAMRHGSKNPTALRSTDDLGRFGLGMKTASLSQCRRMTVVSLKDGALSGRCWDLDHIAVRQDWILLRIPTETIKTLPMAENLIISGHGTLVLWQGFDRLTAGEHSIQSALGNRMDQLSRLFSIGSLHPVLATRVSPSRSTTIQFARSIPSSHATKLRESSHKRSFGLPGIELLCSRTFFPISPDFHLLIWN